MNKKPLPASSDQQLIDYTLAGDNLAFDVIIKRYQDGLYRHLLRLAGEPKQAEALCQDAFVRFYSSLAHFPRDKKVAPLLFKLATNAWKDICRGNHPRTELNGNGLSGEWQMGLEELSPRERQKILEAVDSLQPDFREILSLRYDRGLSYQEIAEITGASRKTIAARLRNSLEAFQLALKKKTSEEARP